MNTTTLKERLGLYEDTLFEEDEEQNETNMEPEAGMTDEELKIESLKIATNIGKLMSNVTTDDIVNIAETVAKFIKGGDNASLETTTDDSEESEDFESLDSNTEDNEEEKEENFEV